MQFKKIIKSTLIGLAAVLILGALGFLIWAKTGTYPAGPTALASLQSTDTLTVTHDILIVFEPADDAETGLIFYPGGLVEPAAYAPVLRNIADNGVLVIIVAMPLNLAIFNTSAANAVIDSYPQISSWIIAGHSLGGTAAAIFAENYPGRIEAIALWDSFPSPSADLSDNAIPSLSIYSASDNFPNTKNFHDNKYLMPADTLYVGIEGANHAQFGDYGPQKGDVEASISLAEQHEQVTSIMLDFIFHNQ